MTQTVFPTLTYADAHAAIEWLERALGAERVAVLPARATARSPTPRSASRAAS